MADLAQNIDNLLNVVVNYGMQQEAIKRDEMRYLERQQQDIDKVNMLGLLEGIDKSSTMEQINATRDAISNEPFLTEIGEAYQQQALKAVNSLGHSVGIRNAATIQYGKLEKQFQEDVASGKWIGDDYKKILEDSRSNSDVAYNAGYIAIAQRLNVGIKQTESQKRIVDYLIEADENRNLDIFDTNPEKGYTPNEIAYYEGMATAADAGDWTAAEGFAKMLPGARVEWEMQQNYEENIATLTAEKLIAAEAKDKAMIAKAVYETGDNKLVTQVRQNIKQAATYSPNIASEITLFNKDSDPREIQPILATQIALVAHKYGEGGKDWSVSKHLRGLVNKAFSPGATDKDAKAVAKWLVANPTEIDDMDFPGTGAANITSRHSLEIRALIRAYEGTMELIKYRGLKIEDETSVKPEPKLDDNDNNNKKRIW